MRFFDLFKRTDINEGVNQYKATKNAVLLDPLVCLLYSGARSGRATSVLREMGYTNVNNIGGIVGYTGRVAR